MKSAPKLEVHGLRKRFGGLVAVDGIDLELQGGEIFGLIGPNGSGKSTVLKLIMGVERPDQGTIRLNGKNIAGFPIHLIARAGVSLVFQHSRPLHRQTVLEHIKLALYPDSLFGLLAAPDIEPKARAIAARVGLADVLDRRPRTLPFAHLRRIELAKAIARDPSVVLLDEPFAGLTAGEIADFSDLIRSFSAEGKAVLLVDHSVKSVAALADRVLAMYLGKPIAQGRASEVIADETVRRVYLGEDISVPQRRAAHEAASQPMLTINGLCVAYNKARALDNVDLTIHQGECVSIVGLNGAGKTTLFNAISGFLPYQGEIAFDGASLRGRSGAAIACAGLAQCPETRELFGAMSIQENLDLAGHRVAAAARSKQERWLFELFPILKERRNQRAQTLSGGEQQMLAIARSLMMAPKLLIIDEPTLGLAPVILEQLSRALETLRRTTPITIVLGEQNVMFALRHADRIYVIEHGRIIWKGQPMEFGGDVSKRLL